MKKLAILFFAAFVALYAGTAHAQVCNDASGFLKSSGQISIGNALVLGPDCQHLQDAGGSPSITLEDIHSKQFAVGNGSTDDTSALQNWINTCSSQGRRCFCDQGTYKISATLSITTVINIIGAGRNQCIFAPSNATQNTFTINTTASYGTIQSIGNAPTVTKTLGAFIQLSSPSSNNAFWTFRDLASGNDYDGFVFGATSVFTVDNVLESCLHICVQTGVTGDSTIINSVFQPSASNSVGLSVGSNGSSSANGSGLRFVNNKINSTLSGTIGIQLFGAAACASCSDLLIADNSIEVNNTAILLGPSNGASAFTNISITGNELNAVTVINNTENSIWLGTIVITGNSILPAGGAGVNIQNAKNINISGNVFTGSSSVAINISAAVTGCVIGLNQFSGASTNISDASNLCGYAVGTVPSASPLSIPLATITNLTSIAVPNGDWDISCTIYYNGSAAATYSQIYSSISLTGGSLDQAPGNFGVVTSSAQSPATGAPTALFSGPSRRKFTTAPGTTTTVFCVGLINGSGTWTMYGQIRAQRVF